MGRELAQEELAMPVVDETPGTVVVHLAARQHFAVPLALHGMGLLCHFYTDLWSGPGTLGATLRTLTPRIQRGGIRRLAERHDDRLPGERVTAFTRFGLEYAWRIRRARTPTERTRAYLWAGDTFGSLVARRGLGDARAVYAVLGSARRVFELARREGRRTLLDEMFCPRLGRRLDAEERRRWPGWVDDEGPDDLAGSADEWESAELELADVVLCGSAFARDYVRAIGVPGDRVSILPYGLPVDGLLSPREPYRGDRPLRLLLVGQVGLRKGVPYLVEALRLLDTRAVETRLVGTVALARSVLPIVRRRCEVVGPVARAEVADHYRWADVLVLPSLCEGSALVTYEALAAGLAVVCTPNAGSPVRDGSDGCLVGVRDAEAIATTVQRFLETPSLVGAMSAAASGRAAEFGLAAYGRRLEAVLTPTAL